VSRIALVKPDKARAIENMILAAAQRGQLHEKVSEQRLVSMLEQISEKQGGAEAGRGPKITIQRRRAFDDDDD
jgi:programmed cell death protein 5